MRQERFRPGSAAGNATRMIAPSVASIEVGTHTARLLLARAAAGNALFQPLARERRTIRLAEGFGSRGAGLIRDDALRRAVEAVVFFRRIVEEAGGEIVRAVSTGVTRTAENREALVQAILDGSGVRVRPVSGDREAELTAMGVLHAVGPLKVPYVIFDLGGGSTEFVISRRGTWDDRETGSLSLGALLLKECFLHGDPASVDELGAASGTVDRTLSLGVPGREVFPSTPLIIGSGGTLTTLAAMIHGIEAPLIDPGLMNGLVLERPALEGLYELIASLPLERRTRLRGLDPGRADVIPAGALAVLRILHHFGARRVTVCLADMLEGLLIEHLHGEGYEQRH
jgi:exopolyphosphatase / guanosine-5'-triphosphate,3'-diphosphate pyrophosphatase